MTVKAQIKVGLGTLPAHYDPLGGPMVEHELLKDNPSCHAGFNLEHPTQTQEENDSDTRTH